MVATDRTDAEPHDRAAEHAVEPAAVEAAHPYWCAWAAVIPGLYYARRPLSSPPLVVRALTPSGLGPAIERAEAERG